MRTRLLAAPLLAAVSLVSIFADVRVPGAEIVALDVYPERIELDGRFDYSQLIVQARRANGEVIDVTREVEIEGDSGLIELDERRLARPVAAGTGELILSIDGQTARIPLVVDGLEAAPAPSFVRDVQPLMSRIGCNTGTCHGSAQGKNGFKLSLRGYDPEFDHAALTDELAGRRFDRVSPDGSLFLRKPTGRVPHEGGVVLDIESRDYELLRAWVEQGVALDLDAPRVASLEVVPSAPILPSAGMSQQFAVLATYDDGSVRDVTAEAFIETNDIEVLAVEGRGLVTALRRGEAAVLARYEGNYSASRVVVMGDRGGWAWEETPEHNWIDGFVYEKLRHVRTSPSELCTDDEFLRRISLDLTGRLPSMDEVRTFLMDTRDVRVKRDEVIDRLIGSAAFVEHWSNRWCDLVQVNSKFLGDEGAVRMRDWVRAQVASNTPYDEFAAALLGSSGSTYENPPAAYYKIQRQPDLVMESTTQLFLGVRFNCNKCHDHPFERWTQDQHWQLAAFFAQIGRENVEGGVEQEERISDVAEGDVTDPDTGVVVPAAFPYEHGGVVPDEAPRRARLVSWLTAAENPYFARSYVNRLWSYLIGVGLIEPVDDIRAGNPPTNPALLDRLEDEFLESGFDVRHMLRLICRSRTYQLSVRTNEWNEDDSVNFSHARARRLPSEVMYDAIYQACGSRTSLPGIRRGTRAAALVDASVKASDGFLDLFGRPPRESVCECERSSGMSMGQALNLVNGETLAAAIQDPLNDLSELATHERDGGRIIDELFVRFLGRQPTEPELVSFGRDFDARDPANLATLDPELFAAYENERAEWEASIHAHTWVELAPDSLRAAGGSELVHEGDGLVRAVGAGLDKETYTAVYWVDTAAITGLRLEVLADEEQPSNGPGRAENGNFVLNELRAALVPAADPTTSHALKWGPATADFSQQGWAVGGAIDGQPNSGWAVMPAFGQSHQAIFEVAAGAPAGASLLVVTLDQQFGTRHTIARFRLSLTTDARPIRHHGIGNEAASALAVAPAERTPAQVAAVHREYLRAHPELGEKMRLGATQDLAWALANSPAFLFNR